MPEGQRRSGMGVKHGKVKRVERFEQVGDVGDEGICQTRRKGKFDRGFHDPRLGLDEIDQETRPGGQDEQRELFPDERADAGPKSRDRFVSAAGARRPLFRLLRPDDRHRFPLGTSCGGRRRRRAQAAERPVIDQEQEEGERHRHLLRHQPRRVAEANRPDAADARMFHVAEVEPERDEPEERAQEILAFGRPGHRFHMERVQSEECRHGSALPEGSGHRPEDEKEEQGVYGVQKEAHQVVAPRVQAEELNVGHVRQPRERVPVVDVGGGKGPHEAVHGQPPPDDRVIGDIVVVVEADEAVIDHRAVDDQRQTHDNGADQNRPAEGG